MSENYHVPCVILGGGVIGLSVAKFLSEKFPDILLIEKEYAYGMETSSRNSEVIHAGIYYKTNSLKRKFCVDGKKKLYSYAMERRIDFKNIEKLIVSTTPSEEEKLLNILQQGINNGVDDLEIIDNYQLKKIEPEVNATMAILSKSTGIIDSHQLMTSLAGDFENNGGNIIINTRCLKIEHSEKLIEILLDDGTVITSDLLISCLGLHSSEFLKQSQSYKNLNYPLLKFAKGNYFTYSGKSPFIRLIYPVPQPGGLGIHLTLDLNNGMRFGPNVEWLETSNPNEIDYTVNQTLKDDFYHSIRSYWLNIDKNNLNPGYSGVRPKLFINNNAYDDFYIYGPDQHGFKNTYHLFGIESPGLTSSLSIGEHILDLVQNG